MNKVLVIIVSYRFEKWMDRTLESLRQSVLPVDIVVVDNHSDDHTTEIIRQSYPEVKLIECNTNLGFGKANNIGMKIAIEQKYDAIFLLNQDAWVEPKTIGTLYDISQKNKKYGILSPVHLTGNGENIDKGFADYAKINERNELPKDQEIVPIEFVNAALWMIPTRIIREMGGFSPLFFLYGEDKDFVNRLRFHGYRIGYVPDTFGYHDRDMRKMTRSDFIRSEYVYHLSEYTNINYNFAKGFGLGILAIIKKAFQSLKKIKTFFMYIKLAFRLLLQTHNVINTRKKAKQNKPNFIVL
ncbi:MAG: glycosyltransferase family 2 protein [Bacteroidaceae bacterium]|nr:glycosyltransferase family 2 protein [Bacteroidaceae bacterium]